MALIVPRRNVPRKGDIGLPFVSALVHPSVRPPWITFWLEFDDIGYRTGPWWLLETVSRLARLPYILTYFCTNLTFLTPKNRLLVK